MEFSKTFKSFISYCIKSSQPNDQIHRWKKKIGRKICKIKFKNIKKATEKTFQNRKTEFTFVSVTYMSACLLCSYEEAQECRRSFQTLICMSQDLLGHFRRLSGVLGCCFWSVLLDFLKNVSNNYVLLKKCKGHINSLPSLREYTSADLRDGWGRCASIPAHTILSTLAVCYRTTTGSKGTTVCFSTNLPSYPRISSFLDNPHLPSFACDSKS